VFTSGNEGINTGKWISESENGQRYLMLAVILEIRMSKVSIRFATQPKGCYYAASLFCSLYHSSICWHMEASITRKNQNFLPLVLV